jgi:hypothetical protein
MKQKNQYYQLITSLPLLQGKLSVDFKSLSDIQFDKLLKELTPDDYKMVTCLQKFVLWEFYHSVDVHHFFQELNIIKKKYKCNKTFISILDLIVDIRLFSGLIRYKKAGLAVEDLNGKIKFEGDKEEYNFNIKHNFDKDDFGIKALDKNLKGIENLINNQENKELEKKHLQNSWDSLSKIAENHYFDIDFLLVYVIKRNILTRWNIINNPQEVGVRFEELATNAIKGKLKDD